MDNASLASVIAPVSPVLAAALTGASAGAALALAALGRAVVGDDQASADEIATVITAGGPDVKLKIRSAEEQLQRALGDAGTTLAALAVVDASGRRDTLVKLDREAAQDRQDARQRQVKTNDITNSVLAYAVTAGFFAILFMLVFYPNLVVQTQLAPEIKSTLQTMLGVLGTAWVGIITYYFGSSVGSKEKTALLEESVVAKAGPNATP